MRKLTQVSGVWTEARCERTDYFYDEGGGTSNGRLTRVRWNWQPDEFGVTVPCATAGGFEERYQYNSAGRITQKKLLQTKRAGSTSGTVDLTANWAFNNEGQVTSVLYPEHFEGNFLSRRQIQNTYDLSGRLSGVDTKLGTENAPTPPWQSVISNVQFNAFGAVTSLNHLGVTETRQYNILGQLTRLSKGTAIDVEYRYAATTNDGKITSQKNWLTGEDVTYQYDELERLISASTTNNTAWGLSWQYDGFGNRLSQTVTQGSGPTHSVLVAKETNQILSAGYAYDANGNMTTMPRGAGSMTLAYDLSNRVKSLSHTDGAEDYIYAPDNRRVWRSAGLTACRATRDNDGQVSTGGSGEYAREQLIFYAPNGQKLGVYCVIFSGNLQYAAVSASEENVMYGSRIVGKRVLAQSYAYGNTALVEDFTVDRLQSKGGGSQFYPYGESKGPGSAGDDREQFATYTRDQKSGLDYADQRWYATSSGRFLTPDPNQYNAQLNRSGSFNGYAYTEGNPINSNDPQGLLGEGCGTWWADARDFGQCSGGGGGGSRDCEMTRAGCVDVGNGGWALVPCVISDPTSAFFGATSFCASADGGDDSPPAIDQEESCVQREVNFLLAYLTKRKSPMANAALLTDLVIKSINANIDSRFIVALAGVETSYGSNVKSDAGTYNYWSNMFHCAVAPSKVVTACRHVDPFGSITEAMNTVFMDLNGKYYKGLSSVKNIYSVFERGSVDRDAPQQGLLDQIYSQLGGERHMDNVRFKRCELPF